MKFRALLPDAGRFAAGLLVAAMAGCATADHAGDRTAIGCFVTGVQAVGPAGPAACRAADRGWPVDPEGEARARLARGDGRFQVWMDDPVSGRAYFPGLSRVEGARLAGTAGVVVEVIDDAEIFPVERDPYSRRAQRAAQHAAMARFNQALFRELDRRSRMAPPGGE